MAIDPLLWKLSKATSREETAIWLDIPNEHLDGKTPSEVLGTEGGDLIIRHLVEDMLARSQK